jgi:hypothetical protein
MAACAAAWLYPENAGGVGIGKFGELSLNNGRGAWKDNISAGLTMVVGCAAAENADASSAPKARRVNNLGGQKFIFYSIR